MRYDESNLLIRGTDRPTGRLNGVTPAEAGWALINFEVRRLGRGERWSFDTGEQELALVLLGGRANVRSNRGEWGPIGERTSPFDGLPWSLYLSRRSQLEVEALTDSLDFAVAWVPSDEDHPSRLIRPADVKVEIRGGDNVTRQINDMIPAGFDCQRLVVVEVYTPSGNWSSYPPHKHDVHKTDAAGNLVEADLDEVYYYRIDPPEGFAFQRIYTAPESPLQRAGQPIDAVLTARDNDLVLVPEGYHPVVSAPGYTTYYLNVLAGSAQSLANTDDPRYAWVKESYQARDRRVPIYSLKRDS
ncbi:MAG: 5-deoxy-glucuronate isomerase [Ardenticatenaceae bacterium]|nr:5-deoxy-glucuronate isomerase [Ardenticatenaceae bacterium]HBY93144.1 5-deoxy-glucuronate isomerase [Chloroflexota bacterium]